VGGNPVAAWHADWVYLTEKFKIRRTLKNGELQGSGKSQDVQSIAHT